MSRQRIVVLGAGGFIGRRIVAALAASDWAEPIAALRVVRPGSAVEQRAVDATSAASLRTVLADADGIVNSIAGDGATLRGNAEALFGLLPSLPRAPRVVHLSTMSVYGSATGLVDERQPLLGDLGEYSAAKVEAERRIPPAAGVVVLRPGIVYGPDSPLWSVLIGRLLRARRLGTIGAAGDGICNLVHVDDVAAATVLALRSDALRGQACNLAVPEAPTWNEYFAGYARALGVDPVPVLSPSRLALELNVIGPLLKVAGRLVGDQRLPPPIRPWLIDQCSHAIRLDSRRAAEGLGLVQRPLADGYADAAAALLRA